MPLFYRLLHSLAIFDHLWPPFTISYRRFSLFGSLSADAVEAALRLFPDERARMEVCLYFADSATSLTRDPVNYGIIFCCDDSVECGHMFCVLMN